MCIRDSGITGTQSYASHQGIFIEEGTTNLVTNPSFEHATFDTNWGRFYSNYDSANDTFTPLMAKRNSAGPFAAGVISQDDYGDLAELGNDSLVYTHSTTINGDFAENADDDQGTLLFWWTPEYSSTQMNTGSAYFYHCLLYTSPSPRDRTRSRMPSFA